MMRKKKAKVAIIDNSIEPAVYNPVRHWSSFLHTEWQAFRAQDRQFPDLKDNFTHVILTGSEASILEREQWVEEEIDIVQKAVERNLYIFGSCYGHQVLAIALAGPEHVRRCVHPEIGWIPVQITRDSVFVGKKRTLYAFASHFDEVIGLSDEFSVLSQTEKCAIQAFQWKEKPVLGVQFHPEMNITEAIFYIQASIAKNDDKKVFYEEGLASAPKDSGLIHSIMKNFFSVQHLT